MVQPTERASERGRSVERAEPEGAEPAEPSEAGGGEAGEHKSRAERAGGAGAGNAERPQEGASRRRLRDEPAKAERGH